jgi:hypothetical protein
MAGLLGKGGAIHDMLSNIHDVLQTGFGIGGEDAMKKARTDAEEATRQKEYKIEMEKAGTVDRASIWNMMFHPRSAAEKHGEIEGGFRPGDWLSKQRERVEDVAKEGASRRQQKVRDQREVGIAWWNLPDRFEAYSQRMDERSAARAQSFHTGGTYRAPMPGGTGLALLRDREKIITPEKANKMSFPETITIVLDEQSRLTLKGHIKNSVREEFTSG